MKSLRLPTATYRLQFNRDFTFADATRIVPYLSALGVSHVYASPFLKARAGSPHGYDIVDHNALNPEIGDQASFDAYIESLEQHGMGQIIDIVPNHMGVGGDDNAWWLDVLEHGQASRYAPYFDIDWHPANQALHNKVLLPVLGDHYGSVLESGELRLEFDSREGAFTIRYFEHLLPVDPRTYPQILAFRLDELAQKVGAQSEAYREVVKLIAACRALARRSEVSTTRRQQRHERASSCKHSLAELVRRHGEIAVFIERNVALLNGVTDQPKSFDRLHRLLEKQVYRLAYWQVASDEINYRRFFDINDLAGLRMENTEVFSATHRLVGQLIGTGRVHGLRVDHPDGLSDPYAYFCDLGRMAREAAAPSRESDSDAFYVVVEKILASHERLPVDWPVAGTTGYEVAHLINGWLVFAPAEPAMSRIYRGVIGRETVFDELLYERKQLVIRSALASELTVLANLLSGIAQADRKTRDFTFHALREALSEVVACFPVYRTYVSARRISEEDRRYAQWALVQAKKRSTAVDILIFDFIGEVLLLTRLKTYRAAIRRRAVKFALRFQQYTAPVMAKGMEDTAFYTYNRLVSLNDVGFDPRVFGVSSGAFHQHNTRRQADWPHSMVTTSTHDSKRGEDVRARIDVLSEVADDWRVHLKRWMRLNRHKKRLVNDQPAPSNNDEYLLYQTLLGTWPVATLGPSEFSAYRQRIEEYMLKALKEAKVHTSWINPNEEYEAATRHFIHVLLADAQHTPFLADFLPFQARLCRFGLYNSLSQTLLKLTVPGVPDIYQGNELLAFTLVDPDNRRGVDYDQRRLMLHALAEGIADAEQIPTFVRTLVEHIDDGRAKLYLTWRALELRRRCPQLFSEGAYTGLATNGDRAEHLCAFSRHYQEQEVIVVAPRWFARLPEAGRAPPLGMRVWGDTTIASAADASRGVYRDIFTGAEVTVTVLDGRPWLRAAELFAHFPVALLLKQ